MEYRNFGRTGLMVSPICLGCMMFGGKTEPADSYKIIDRAIDGDINFIDTANVYSRGRSEEVTGEALKEMVNVIKLYFLLVSWSNGRWRS